MAELVDAQDLGSCVERRKGSSPFVRTNFIENPQDEAEQENEKSDCGRQSASKSEGEKEMPSVQWKRLLRREEQPQVRRM